jgi:hypothetical protein
MTHARPNLAALVIGLVALSMLSCRTPSRKPAAKVQLAPIGTFVGPAGAAVVKVRLNADGTYIAQDLAEPRYSFIAEGRTLFPSRVDAETQKGTWTCDKQSGDLMLRPASDNGWRWNISHLRVDEKNPNRIAWGSGFLERQKD